MQPTFYHRLNGLLWAVIVLALVVLAVYVSLGRMLVSNLGPYQQAILGELNLRVPFTVHAQRLRGEWESFTPFIVLEGLQLSFPEGDETPLQLSAGRVGIDVWHSLRTRALQVTSVELDDLALRGEVTPDRRFRLLGFGDGGGETGEWLRTFLLNVERVSLRRGVLQLRLPGGESRDFDLDLSLRRQGSTRTLEADLTSTAGGRIALLGQGVGDPFRAQAFSGELYAHLRTSDLGAARALVMAGAPPVWAEGELDLELWLSLERGDSALQARLEARELVLAPADASWQFPLQRLAVQTHVSQARDRWTVHASDLLLGQPGAELRIPRLQLDAWGSALRLRATEVPLAGLTGFTAASPSLPPELRDLAAGLDLSGRLSALQINLADVARPVDDWELEANFEELALASYRGAPGASGVSGYAHLVPGRGRVLVDARDPTLVLPQVYRRPLDFDELYGTLDLQWDDRSVDLRTGLVSAAAPEGLARALFTLEIPRVPTQEGVEMELLVGLADTTPEYREKYLPYVLDPALLDWLSDSVGAGTIHEGAFLWRGSLRGDAHGRRTVQLAFDVSDLELDYHPDWPAVTLDEGTALIDDTRVSVWGQRARLLDSRLENLSVETWLDETGNLALALSGEVEGPVKDGLSVLTSSPLGALLDHALDDWQMRGELRTTLAARLSLARDGAPPAVSVQTRWQDVDVDIQPGGLPLRGLRGDLSYHSAGGFRSGGLEGELWGRPLRLAVQQPAGEGGGYDPASSPVDILAESVVSLSDLRQWLQLEALDFASGETPARVTLRIDPGAAAPEAVAMLTAHSSLRGVKLDLPPPLGKEAGSERPLRLALPLGGDTRRLDLSIEESLELALEFGDGKLHAAALGLGATPPPLRRGVASVGGVVPALDVQQWLSFAAPRTPGTRPYSDTAEAPGTDALPLQLRVEDLWVQSLSAFGRTLRDVRLRLASLPGGWAVALDSDWLRGGAVWDTGGGRSRVELDYLDISRLGEYLAPVPAETAGQVADGAARDGPPDLPPTDVVLGDIVQGGRRLGELAFSVRASGGRLLVDDLRGELAHLKIDALAPGALRWEGAPGEQTRVQARLGFDDIGDTLHHFGYERVVETEHGAVDVDLSWPGSPADFAVARAAGKLQLDVGAGRFPEAPSGASGALRVVSILNLVDLVQRLSLAHMFESGIPFDSVTGEVRLQDGVIEVPGMAVRGGSSFQFSGRSPVDTRRLQGELVATLPVAQNLPWVAALAASLPVAAGVFVVSQLFDEQMNRLTSGVYRIDGTWDDPQLGFDRIFDDTARALPDTSRQPADEGAAGRGGRSAGPDDAPRSGAEARAADESAAGAEEKARPAAPAGDA